MKNDVWAVTRSAEFDGVTERVAPLLDAKIMLVDDEPLMTALIQTHLEDEGYLHFVVANDPRQSLELLRREQPSLMLLDLMMPQLSGFEVLEAVRADRSLRYIPVIVLTAATGADSKLRALRLGATDFLAKPVDASELVLRVRNTLAFRQYHERLINFDAITELPNERLFDSGLEEMVARAGVVGGVVALFSLTVPECRSLSETLGREAAAEFTRGIASRLRRVIELESPPSALATPVERAPRLARLAPDQFGLLLEGLRDAEAVEAVAKRLIYAVSEPMAVGAHEVVPTAWIGIALAPADGNRPEALRKSADLAATEARQQETLRVQFASAELNTRSYERLALGSQLRGAAQRGELRAYYQPKVDLVSGRIVSAEALVRWQHPEHGLLPPGRFIPLAEQTGLIGVIGQWVMEQACRDAAEWPSVHGVPVKVAVNVARPQFVAGSLLPAVRQAALDSGLPPQRLVLEITESMLMEDIEGTMSLMAELRDLGVSISLDDFGTGYSSLSYLRRLPLDELKIDRSFVIDLPGRQADAIVATVIGLGHSLGMKIVAEGVETEAQAETLARLGCDVVQGYLYSRPVPVEQFVELLRR